MAINNDVENMSPEERQSLANELSGGSSINERGAVLGDQLQDEFFHGARSLAPGMQEGLLEFAQDGYLLARSLTDFVGLTDKKQTKLDAARVEADRAAFRRDNPTAGNIATTTKYAAEILGPAKGAGMLVRPLAKGASTLATIGYGAKTGAVSGGLSAGLMGQDVSGIPVGAAIGGATGGLVGAVQSLVRPRDMNLKEFKDLTTRQSINKDPRPASVKEAEGKIRDLSDKFADTRSVSDTLDDVTGSMLKNVQKVNNTRYGVFRKVVDELGPQQFDDVVLDNQKLINSIILPGGNRPPSSESRVIMKDFIENGLKGKTLGEAHQALIDVSGQLNFKDPAVKQLYAAVKNSIITKANQATISGKPAGEFLTKTDDIFKSFSQPTREFGEKMLGQIENGNFDELTTLFTKNKTHIKVWKAITEHMDGAQKEALEGGILRSVLSKVEVLDDIDPVRYAKQIDSLIKGPDNPYLKLLSKDSIKSLQTIKDGAKAISRHPDAAANSLNIDTWHRFALKLYDTRLGKAVLTKAADSPKTLNNLITRVATSGIGGAVGAATSKVINAGSESFTDEDIRNMDDGQRLQLLNTLIQQGRK